VASPLSYSDGGYKGLIEKIKALMERADKNLQFSKLLLYCHGSYRAEK
jgi:cobalamin biosynthesis Co2+ chelatase CbiK